jgi:hypothetical protein
MFKKHLKLVTQLKLTNSGGTPLVFQKNLFGVLKTYIVTDNISFQNGLYLYDLTHFVGKTF